jgi:hypothetical protein
MRRSIFLLIAAAIVTMGMQSMLQADHRNPRNQHCAPSGGHSHTGAGWHQNSGSGWHSFAGDGWYSGGAYRPRYDDHRSYGYHDNCRRDYDFDRGFGGAYGYGYGGYGSAYGYGGLYGVDPFYRSGRGVELNSGRFRIQFGF